MGAKHWSVNHMEEHFNSADPDACGRASQKESSTHFISQDDLNYFFVRFGCADNLQNMPTHQGPSLRLLSPQGGEMDLGPSTPKTQLNLMGTF